MSRANDIFFKIITLKVLNLNLIIAEAVEIRHSYRKVSKLLEKNVKYILMSLMIFILRVQGAT